MDDHNLPLPEESALVTVLLIVEDVDRSRNFYTDVLGGEVVRAAGPAMVKLHNTWIIINLGGGPTADKPGVVAKPPENPDVLSIAMNFRVANVQQMYDDITAKGGEFLTPPKDMGQEIRCYLRDPDGYLIEFGQTTVSAEELMDG